MTIGEFFSFALGLIICLKYVLELVFGTVGLVIYIRGILTLLNIQIIPEFLYEIRICGLNVQIMNGLLIAIVGIIGYQGVQKLSKYTNWMCIINTANISMFIGIGLYKMRWSNFIPINYSSDIIGPIFKQSGKAFALYSGYECACY